MFGAIPVVGLGLNLLVIPLCTLFMAECVLFLGAVATGIPLLRDTAAGALEASGLLMLELNAHGSHALEPALVHGVAPMGALAAGAVLLALAGAASESCGGRRARPQRALPLALLVGCRAFIPTWPRAPAAPAIVMLDVGRGGRGLFPEAGLCSSTRARRDAPPGSCIEPALRAEGRGRVRVAILSHAHLDHFGGFEWLARRGWVGTLWENGRDRRGAWRHGLAKALRRHGGRAVGVARDTTLALGPGTASLTIFRGIAAGARERASRGTPSSERAPALFAGTSRPASGAVPATLSRDIVSATPRQ
jgi:hypothetical protein